jgi:peptide deformylase
MFDIMYKTDGIGLAAPQVGVNARLMVYNPEGSPDSGSESVLVNPRIVSKSRTTCWMEEGCLSFPDTFADVLVCTCLLCYSA